MKSIKLSELEEIVKKIQPIVEEETLKGKKIFYAVNCNPKNESFNWKEPEDLTEIKNVDHLSVKEITTEHNYGYYGFFKPSTEEVVSQLSAEDIKEYDFFSTEYAGFTEDNARHVGITKLYKKKK